MPKSKAAYDLLAPVPLVHLLSAIENGMPGEIAFGSERDRFFGNLVADVTIGMRVWIYASKTGSANLDPARRQRVCFLGDFGGSTETGLSYPSLHEVRPPSAKTGDTAWILLWLVRNLRPINPCFYHDFFSASTGKPLAKEPEGQCSSGPSRQGHHDRHRIVPIMKTRFDNPRHGSVFFLKKHQKHLFTKSILPQGRATA